MSQTPDTLVTTLQDVLERASQANAARLARRGRLADAEQLLARAARAEDAPVGILDLQARILAQQGRLSEAVALWQRALAREPGNQAAAAALRRAAALQRPGLWRLATAPLSVGVALGLCLALLGLGAWRLAHLPTPTPALLGALPSQSPSPTPALFTAVPSPSPSPVASPTSPPAPTSTPVATASPTRPPPSPTLTPAPTRTPLPTQSPSPTPPVVGLVTGLQWLNVRTGPGTNYPVKGGDMAVGWGTPLTILATDPGRGCNNTWYKVQLPDGTVGWVCAAYVRIK